MAHDPSAFIQEYFRIRKTDGQGLNAAFDGGDPAENTNTSIGTGVLFRIRFKVRETAAGSDSTGFKIQVKRNAGAFVDADVLGGSTAPATLAVLSAQFDDGDATNVELLTSTTTDVDGDGNENLTSGTLSLTSEETELEWCLQIMGFHDGPTQNIVNDTLEFRVVEADGTVFAGTYTNPVITVTETAGYIGGTYIEHPHVIGPFVDTNDNIYTFIEHSVNDNNVVCIKSTDDGLTWREIDGGNRPTTQDFEGASVFQDGNTLHILQVETDVWYHTFRMSDHASPDTWGITDESVDSTYIASSQQVGCIFVRGDSTIVAFYVDDQADSRIRYKIRNGTWGSLQTLDTTAAIDFQAPFGVLGESNKIHVVYKDDTNGILYHKSLNSSDVEGSRHEIATGLATATGSDAILHIEPTYYDDEGVEVIMIMYKKALTALPILARPVKDDGSPGTEVTATNLDVVSTEGGNAMTIASAHVGGKRIWLFFAQFSDHDIYRVDNDDEGGWTTATEVKDAVTAHWIKGRVIVEGSGDTVFGYLWDDGSDGGTGFVKYDTFLIAAGGAFTLTADQGSYTFTGLAANLSRGFVLTAGQGTFSFSGLAASLITGYSLTADQGSFTISGLTAGLTVDRLLTADQGSYALSGQTADLLRGYTLGAAQGSYALTGQAVNLPRGYIVAAAQGSYSLSGQVANLPRGYALVAVQGGYALVGAAVGLTVSGGATLVATQGSYALSGQAVSLLVARQMVAAQGSYALSGQAVGLIVARQIVAAQGSYALSGQAVGLIVARQIVAAQGSYALTGQGALLVVGMQMAAAQGSYSLAGQTVLLPISRSLVAAQGSYTLSGQAIDLTIAMIIAAAMGSYDLIGQVTKLIILMRIANDPAFVFFNDRRSYADFNDPRSYARFNNRRSYAEYNDRRSYAVHKDKRSRV